MPWHPFAGMPPGVIENPRALNLIPQLWIHTEAVPTGVSSATFAVADVTAGVA
jgi:hypothetical protein